jgi:hypothetical protein
MNIPVVKFARNNMSRNMEIFFNEYDQVYPDASSNTDYKLYQRFVGVVEECKLLVYGYAESIGSGLIGPFEELKTVFWLLYDVRSTFSPQLQSFIIKTHDLTLSKEDYVLLFYASLQSAEVQDAVRDLPLSMVYDMFMPIAQSNFNDWKLNS